jgi:hypothetical protein
MRNRRRHTKSNVPAKFGENSPSKKGENGRRKMNLNTSLRTIETSTSKDFLKMLIEEKCEEFGFKPDDLICSIELEGIPDIIPMRIKFKKEKEVKIIKGNG